MDSKQANEIIKQDKAARETKRLAQLQTAPRYRVYWVNPITSLFHQLPFVDILETDESDPITYLVVQCGCPFDESKTAVKAADAGKMGVCIKSRFTTYLVERLS